MSNQLWSVFITGLGEMDLVARPEDCSFLAITCIEVIGRVDELSGGESWLRSPLTSRSRASNCCSQIVRSVVMAGNVFIQSGVSAASRASSSIQPSAPT